MKKNSLLIIVTGLLSFGPTAKAQTKQIGWLIAGNSNITTSKFLGTTNNQPLIIKTNNAERIRVLGNGNVGIGTASPVAKLDVNGTAHFGNVSIAGNLTATSGIASASVGNGVSGTSLGPDSSGVYGEGWFGVWGRGLNIGVYAIGDTYGVYGSGNTYGVYGFSPNYAGYFAGNVYSTGSYQGSDRTLKQNIRDFVSAMSIINKLHPTQYEFRQDGKYKLMNLPAGSHYGLVAQDVEKVLPDLVKETKFDPAIVAQHKPGTGGKNVTTGSEKSDVINFKALNYTELIPIMIKGMQELSAKDDLKDKQIESLQKQNNDLEQRIAKLETMMNVQQSTTLSSASIEQNIPNPFMNNTIIGYSLPQKFTSAQIVITDKEGKTIKSVNISGNGRGSLNLNASALASGTYQYSFIVDRRIIATKQMAIAK